MFQQPDSVRFQLPPWLNTLARSYEPSTDIEQRMALVIAASRRSVEMQTGGPFGAGIFDSDSGELIALGANLVTSEGLSMLHAEMVAISLAQRKFGSYYLSGQELSGQELSRQELSGQELSGQGLEGQESSQQKLPRLELVTSTEPCTMCLGGILWSGLRRVIAAAADGDARKIGFDEGPKPDDWIRSLNERGIEVIAGIGREQARAVLELYEQTQGHIYIGRKLNGPGPG
ncbi:nucleoside deaminase [Pseudomaricurvus alcaniphilus]|uniref:nucleoside deaminase n=1 Tax=Pseudomaricurvus alcaniphilus TaxID=1166482 RepID=UPI001409C5F4|nr:nucleoside deaminase [Pseudomaricurvus alcaniphilus]NHN38655.1 nucleoside deaminase [Pseudomaricurvus alcaniphilus]